METGEKRQRALSSIDFFLQTTQGSVHSLSTEERKGIHILHIQTDTDLKKKLCKIVFPTETLKNFIVKDLFLLKNV